MCCVYCSVGVGSGLFHVVSLVSPLGLDRLHNQAAIGQSHGQFCLCVISFPHSVHTHIILATNKTKRAGVLLDKSSNLLKDDTENTYMFVYNNNYVTY